MCRIHVTLVFECSLDDDPTFVIQSADQRSSHSCLEAIPYVAVIKTRAACPPIWSERMRNRLERNKILGQFFHHVLNQTSIRINELDAEQLMHPNDSTLSGFQFQLDSVIYGKPRVALLHWDPRQWKEDELVQVFLEAAARSEWLELYTLLQTDGACEGRTTDKSTQESPIRYGWRNGRGTLSLTALSAWDSIDARMRSGHGKGHRHRDCPDGSRTITGNGESSSLCGWLQSF